MNESEGDGGAGPILAMVVVGLLVVVLGFGVFIYLFSATPSVSTVSPTTVPPAVPVHSTPPPARTGTVTPPSAPPAPGPSQADPGVAVPTP